MTPADEARAFELVREKRLSYAEAGKVLGAERGLGKIPKTTIRAAVTREAVRRAKVRDAGVAARAGLAPLATPGADAGFMARVLDAGPLPEPDDEDDDDLDIGLPPADRLHVAPPSDDDEGDDAELDFGKWIRKQIRRLERHVRGLQEQQMEGEAQKYSRTLAVYVSQLRQFEKQERADDGVMTYTAADVEAVRADLRKKFTDTMHRGLVCKECGSKIRRREAEGEDT